MPTTSIHILALLLKNLNRLAAERGVSRNRVIVEACERTVDDQQQTGWPEGFFENDHLNAEDLELLRATGDDWFRAVVSARSSQRRPPF